MKGRVIRPNVFSVGAIDWNRRLFDEIITLPGGTSYNSYLIKGSEKTALIDTVDPSMTQVLESNLDKLEIEKLDYLIASHAEQDHSGSIPAILKRFPEAVVVTNEKCMNILKDEMNISEDKFMLIKDGEEISLGDKHLQFIFTPWVHWPETMSTLLKEDKILFSGDFFGSHLATSDMFVKDYPAVYDGAKRYYGEIMQPFASIIRKNLKKVRSLTLDYIAPTHGPIYGCPDEVISWYEEWASPVSKREVIVAYASMHGSTQHMAEYFVQSLIEKGMKVVEFNLTTADTGEVAMAIIDASALVVASPTFLGGVHPNVAGPLYVLNSINPKTKIVGYIGSGEWGGQVEKDFANFTSNFRAKRLDPIMVKGHPREEDFKRLDKLAEGLVAAHDEVKDVENNHQKVIPLNKPPVKDVNIVLSGEAGQGLQSIQGFLTELLKEEGYYIFSTQEIMSRIRGGSNSVTIRVSSKPTLGFKHNIDLFLPIDAKAIDHVGDRINNNTVILGQKDFLKTEKDIVDVPIMKLAKEVGSTLYSNTVAVGIILGLFKANIKHFYDLIEKKFERKGDKIVNENHEAAEKGYQIGIDLAPNFNFDIPKNHEATEQIFVNGAEAIGLGAIAGGCNFIAAYPMSPSTGVLQYLAKHRQDFGIVVEQVEDEITAINWTVAAWYAGARALANTSGGGFALMGEGVSLAGITESPVVTHIAQRPGPGTGLPTRTGQEDFNLVLYAGHGEFHRAIFAPGTVEEGFIVTQKSFCLADKYQIPVFVLTDQYFMDTLNNVPRFDLKKVGFENKIVETDANYKRYAYTESGISPRGVPGFGKGLVCSDSDEHDETGHITESMQVRNEMVHKRAKRLAALKEDVLAPTKVGLDEYDTLVISWGTTFGSVKEAVETIGDKKICYLHYSQVYPVHPKTEEWMKKAKKVIVVENNSTGQFAQLIKRETGISSDSVLRYDGLPFSVEELVQKIGERHG